METLVKVKLLPYPENADVGNYLSNKDIDWDNAIVMAEIKELHKKDEVQEYLEISCEEMRKIGFTTSRPNSQGHMMWKPFVRV